MKTRIEELLAHFEMSPSKFADELGIQRSGMSHILSGRNKPSLELMQKVLARFPEVSTDWLISGKGDMLNAPKQPVTPPIAEVKMNDVQVTNQISEKEISEEPVKEGIGKIAVVVPGKEETVEKDAFKPAKPIATASRPVTKPVIQAFTEPQPEKMVLPREQLALFEVPAIEQQATGANDPPAIYNITPANNKNKDIMTNTDRPTEKPAAVYSLPDNGDKQAAAQIEMAKAIATTSPGKIIERIVVFYSDKTFSAYSPE